MPTITSNFFLFSFRKQVSAEKGPETLNFDLFKSFTTGLMIFSSSLNLLMLSQWGLRPKIPILGLKPIFLI